LSRGLSGLGLNAQAGGQICLAQPERLVEKASGLVGQPGPSLHGVQLGACGRKSRGSAKLVSLNARLLEDPL
jgi:hypothetical protein